MYFHGLPTPQPWRRRLPLQAAVPRTSSPPPQPPALPHSADPHRHLRLRFGRRHRHRHHLLPFLAPLQFFPVLNFLSPLRFSCIDVGEWPRFLLAANAIVAAYALFETCAAVYQILTGGATLFPEPMQLLFDFAHDQAFAYMAVAAGAAWAADARRVRGQGACEGGFCVKADVAVAMGFAAFVFLALTALITGYRIAGYLTTGSGRQQIR
ncbi:hypothetical protein ZIOFF_024788 [Zingiber officinale]|uniref:CASP-like protein n=1 Tax=Zingiber officinale TaxID=94328 RepID=A0A8J5LDQ1_ZINOF|nr:hypothetical protein ZIOFF_024788 [Zingiber officinale]